VTIAEISNMTKVERLQTMEAIWDSLTHETTEIESPEWHEDTLQERRKKIEEGKAKFISIKELKAKHGR